MQVIQNDIKSGNFHSIYLIFGEENYLKRYYKNRLVQAMVGENTMNLNSFSGKQTEIRSLIDLSETLPFFAERRVILLEDSGLFKGKEEILSEYLKDVPESTCFVFVETEVDRRSKMFKTVKEKGHICECRRQTDAALERWIAQRLRQEGRKITRDNLTLILTRIGDDMDLLEKELDKLVAYTQGKEIIEREDILEIGTIRLESRIFDLMDAISEKNRQQVMKRYDELISLREPPMRILYMLGRQFRLLLQVKQLAAHGLGEREIAEKIGVQSFAVRKCLKQTKYFTLEELREAKKLCLETEEAVKTGRAEEKTALELILIQYGT